MQSRAPGRSPRSVARVVAAIAPLLCLLTVSGCGSNDGNTTRTDIDSVLKRIEVTPDHPVNGQAVWAFHAGTDNIYTIAIIPYDVNDRRLAGAFVHVSSSNPAVVSIDEPNLQTEPEDQDVSSSGIAIATCRVGARGDATITVTAEGYHTVDDKPVVGTMAVHVTGPAVRLDGTGSSSLVPGSSIEWSLHAYDDAGEETVATATCNVPAPAKDILRLGPFGLALNMNIFGLTRSYIPLPDVLQIGGFTSDGSDSPGGDVDIDCTLDNPDAGEKVIAIHVGDGLSVAPLAASIVVGGKAHFVARAFTGGLSTDVAATWSSSDTSVAAAASDDPGTFLGVSSGTTPGRTANAVVQAAFNGMTAKAMLTVYRSPARLAIDVLSPADAAGGTSVTLDPAGQATFKAVLYDTDGTTIIPLSATSVVWSTDDPTVATVPSNSTDETVVLTAVKPGAARIRATTAEGLQGAFDVVVAGAPAGDGCYRECPSIEALRQACVPMAPCTSSQTPPPTYPPDFYFCYDNGVRIASMSTDTGSRHTQYKPDGTSVCFIIDTTFSGASGRIVTETWRDPAGNVVGTETYDTMDATGGQLHTLTCDSQSVMIDVSSRPDCATPSNCTSVSVPANPGDPGCIAPKL